MTVNSGISTEATTSLIQAIIDKALIQGETAVIPAGNYIVGSLFVPSHSRLFFEQGAHLYGSKQLTDYRQIKTRIAGIDMVWPAAILNIYEVEDIEISGPGVIDGQGETWWQRFWGQDGMSGMLGNYTAQGLRWAVDYDCQRPRNIAVFKSKNIRVSDLSSLDSGFWNTHICYSNQVLLENLVINNGLGPSTDGIDLDSSRHIIIRGCQVKGNDDNICVKAGRGQQAASQKTICSDILIEDCLLGRGSGITLGSETSGGIQDITIHNITYDGTGVGLRIKSANNRGGFIKNIKVDKLRMKNVQYPFMLQTNWYPEYSYSKIPDDYQGQIPSYWRLLLAGVPGPDGRTEVGHLKITDVVATRDRDCFSRGFFIEGDPDNPITKLSFDAIQLDVQEFGKISGVESLKLNQVELSAPKKTADQYDKYER